jgi:2-polyprenyl-3-methyl-5-hydroxy-6-metoxy-1,4-benzoquinol methylase
MCWRNKSPTTALGRPEYDEWFRREGRYDRSPAHRAEWMQEVSALHDALRSRMPFGDVLEIACGTGLWTSLLARGSARVLAIDASPEAIALNENRVRTSIVVYQLADVFSWWPTTAFDVVFFSLWLSHVPRTRFDAFWRMVEGRLGPRDASSLSTACESWRRQRDDRSRSRRSD